MARQSGIGLDNSLIEFVETPDYNDAVHNITNESGHYLRVSDACIVRGGGAGYVLPQRVRLLNSFDLLRGTWSRIGYAFHSGLAMRILLTNYYFSNR